MRGDLKEWQKMFGQVGAIKREGSNVISFRCNADYQKLILELREEIAPMFGLEVDDFPISAVVKFALFSAASEMCLPSARALCAKTCEAVNP